jgi:hypothetical protein
MRFKTLLILPFLVASLQAATVDDLYLALNYDSTEYNVSYCLENASGSLEIPETYNGLPVTSIGVRAFDDCTNLNSITIPDSVTLIADAAFEDCTNLNSITIPDGLISIAFSTFRNCSSLTSINIPDSVTYIGISAFSGCSGLTSINISDSLTSIGSYAFFDCSSLTSVTIPDGVTSIGDGVFKRCSNLTSITIGDSVTSIGEDAFQNCTSLTSISIPDSVTSIGSNAFYDCFSLNSGFVPNAEIANNIGYETGSFLSNSMFELIADRLLQDDDFVARLLELIPQGPTGETGPQGIQGDTGPQGPPGLDSSAIQTLRASEPHVEASQDGTFNVQYRIQSSKDLNNWNEETVINSKMDPHNSSKQFLRLTVE